MSDAGDDWNARKLVMAADRIVTAAEMMERVFAAATAAVERLAAALEMSNEQAAAMMCPGHPPAEAAGATASPAATPASPKRTCNRHHDCDVADATFRSNHNGSPPPASFHCHDDECSDCFGD